MRVILQMKDTTKKQNWFENNSNTQNNHVIFEVIINNGSFEEKYLYFWGGRMIFIYLFIYLYFLCLGGLHVCVSTHHSHAVPTEVRRECNTIELEWKMVPSCHLDAGNWHMASKKAASSPSHWSITKSSEFIFYVCYIWKIFLYLLYVYQNDIS